MEEQDLGQFLKEWHQRTETHKNTIRIFFKRQYRNAGTFRAPTSYSSHCSLLFSWGATGKEGLRLDPHGLPGTQTPRAAGLLREGSSVTLELTRDLHICEGDREGGAWGSSQRKRGGIRSLPSGHTQVARGE